MAKLAPCLHHTPKPPATDTTPTFIGALLHDILATVGIRQQRTSCWIPQKLSPSNLAAQQNAPCHAVRLHTGELQAQAQRASMWRHRAGAEQDG